MATTQIQVTAADNELMLIASTPAGSVELLRYKSGYFKPVNVTVYPGTILPTGSYDLTMVGINWGGPAKFEVVVTTDGRAETHKGDGNTSVGVNWTKTIKINVVAGQ